MASLLTAEDLPKFDELLSFLTTGEVQLLYEHLEEKQFSDGEEVFPQNSPGNALYIIKKGKVRIFINLPGGGRKELTELSVGHILGEMAFLMGEPHSAGAMASGDTEIFLLYRDDFDLIQLEDPSLAFKIMQALTKILGYRLRRVNQQLAELSGRLEGR